MRKQLEIWLKGVLMATVSGASGGVVAGLSTIVVAPGLDGLATAKLVAASAVMAGATGLFGYLKQSPIPPEDAEPPVQP